MSSGAFDETPADGESSSGLKGSSSIDGRYSAGGAGRDDFGPGQAMTAYKVRNEHAVAG